MRRSMGVIVSLLLGAAPAVRTQATTATGQQPAVAAGRLVRLSMRGPRRVYLVGTLTRLTADTVVLRKDPRLPETEYPRADIAEMWVQNGERPASKKGIQVGAKIGALVGLGAGVSYAATTVPADCPVGESCRTLSGQALTYGLLGVGLGAGAGALLGSALGRTLGREPIWSRVDLTTVKVAFIARPGGGAVGISIRW